MNQHLKLAYEHGVQVALEEAGITKTAAGISGFIDDLLGKGARKSRDSIGRLSRSVSNRVENLTNPVFTRADVNADKLRRVYEDMSQDARGINASLRDRLFDQDIGYRVPGVFQTDEIAKAQQIAQDAINSKAIADPRFKNILEESDELAGLSRLLRHQENKTRSARRKAGLGVGAVGTGAALSALLHGDD